MKSLLVMDNIVAGGGQYNYIEAGSGDDILVGGGQYNEIHAGDGENIVVGGGQDNLYDRRKWQRCNDRRRSI